MPLNDDYFSLARLEDPQMMPAAPRGAGAIAGLMYGRDKARQDQALQGAAGLAQMRALMEQQADTENMAGAPGRMAGIDYSNQMAAGKLANINNDLSTQSDLSKTAQIKAEMQKVAPYAMNYDPTDMSNQDKRDFIKSLQDQGITKIGKKNLSDLSDDDLDKFDKFMQQSKMSLINTPEFQQKMMEAGVAAQSRENVANTLAGSRRDVAGINKDARISSAELYSQAKRDVATLQEQAKAGKLSMSQWEANMRDKASRGEATPGELAQLQNLVDTRTASILQKANQAGLKMSIDPNTGEVKLGNSPGFSSPRVPNGDPNATAATPASQAPTLAPQPTPDENTPKLSSDGKSVVVKGKKYDTYSDGKNIIYYDPDAKKWVPVK